MRDNLGQSTTQKWLNYLLVALLIGMLCLTPMGFSALMYTLFLVISFLLLRGLVRGVQASGGLRYVTLVPSGWLGSIGLACLAMSAVPYSAERWELVRDLVYAALLMPLLGGIWSGVGYLFAWVKVEMRSMGITQFAFCLNGIALLFALISAPPLLDPRVHGSRKTKSLNNIKQLAIAVQTYSQDYNETFPGWLRNPDGAYAHNCWDEQINPQVKAKDAFNNGDTGIKSVSDPLKQRVLTYGLNGLLIAPHKGDGNADFAPAANNPPASASPSAVGSPAETILFAELATNTAMNGLYGSEPVPAPVVGRVPAGNGSRQWRNAMSGWIDISPRDFIETTAVSATANPYHEPYGVNANRGVARDLYGGGGVYAFCDGHAVFLKVSTTVGIGTTVGGKPITEANCWSPENTNNMWIPW